MELLKRIIDWTVRLFRKKPDAGGGKGGDMSFGPGTTIRAGDAIGSRDGGSIEIKAGDGGDVLNEKGRPEERPR